MRRPVPPPIAGPDRPDALGNTQAEQQVTRPPPRGRGLAEELVASRTRGESCRANEGLDASDQAVAVKPLPLTRRGLSAYPLDLPVATASRTTSPTLGRTNVDQAHQAAAHGLPADCRRGGVTAWSESVALARPTADFDWAPKPVVAGTPVTFTSTSTPFHEPYTPITRAEWTIQGAGTFTGNQVTVTAPAAGPWTVRLHVWDRIGEDGEVTKVINVQPAAAASTAATATATAASASTARESTSHSSPCGSSCVPARRGGGDLVSYSEDADGRISEHAWDLNGDGTFDEVGARRYAQVLNGGRQAGDPARHGRQGRVRHRVAHATGATAARRKRSRPFPAQSRSSTDTEAA